MYFSVLLCVCVLYVLTQTGTPFTLNHSFAPPPPSAQDCKKYLDGKALGDELVLVGGQYKLP